MSSMGSRRRHTAAFKAKVALAALRGEEMVAGSRPPWISATATASETGDVSY